MRNLLALLGAGTLTFVGLGWYLDWYRVERQPAPAGHQRLQLDINPEKISQDVQAGIERGSDFIDSIRNKPGSQQTNNVPPIVVPTPGGAIIAPNPAAPPPAASDGWRPIGSGSFPVSADDDAARRFNVRPLPPPR